MKLNRLLISGFLAISLLTAFIAYFAVVANPNKLTPPEFFVIAGSLTVAALVIGIFISGRISGPIRKLTSDVEQITKGKLDIRLGSSNIDEIRSLNESLERILASLKLAVLRTGGKKEDFAIGEAIQAKLEAEEKYKTLFNNAKDAIIIADPKTKRLVDANKAAEKLTGYARGELIMVNADKLHPEDRIKETMEGFEKQAKGTIDSVNTEVLTKGGKRIPVSINSANIKLGDKSLIQGIFRDVSESAAIEGALRESEEKHRMIFENANDIIIYVDKEGKIADVNKKIETILGYRKKDIVGVSFSKIGVLQAKVLPKIVKVFSTALASGKVLPVVDLELTARNGEKIPFEISATAIEKEGKTEGVLAILRDLRGRSKPGKKIG